MQSIGCSNCNSHRTDGTCKTYSDSYAGTYAYSNSTGNSNKKAYLHSEAGKHFHLGSV